MKTIYHSVKIDVTHGTNTAILDLPQGDYYSHNIIIWLYEGHRSYDISGYTPSLKWYNEDDDKTIVSDAVNIINPVKGQLSYIPAAALLKDDGRYVVQLRLKATNGGISSQMSFRFIINVNKDIMFEEDENVEVTISKEYKEQLDQAIEHMKWHPVNGDYPENNGGN